MKIYSAVLFFFILNSSFGQQRIVSSSYIFTYQFALFDSDFKGRIQTISVLKNTKDNITHVNEPDTLTYISNKEGLFDYFDTSKLNLNNMFEGIHFDYNPSSKKFTDESAKEAVVFDTAYKQEQNNFNEVILFYPLNNYFIHKQRRNTDTSCRFMTRQFNKQKSIIRITYYNSKNKCVANESALTYLSNTKFSEMYEFKYVVLKGVKKITSINYYRTDEKTGMKTLYASNKYLYRKGNLLQKAFFEQFNGIARIKGETMFKYYPEKRGE